MTATIAEEFEDQPPELDESEYEIAPEDLDLPDLTGEIPPRPPEQTQDIFEGFGAPGDARRTPAEALRECIKFIRSRQWIEAGYCLRYTRGWYLVDSLYMSAKEALYGAPVKHRITDWTKVPRGVIVYLDAPWSENGHVAPSLGSGWLGSTDWPTNRVGRVRGDVMMASWNYTAAYWSPYINGVKVWQARNPKPEPEPEHRGTPRVSALIEEIAHLRKRSIEKKNLKRVDAFTEALRALRDIQIEVRK